MPRERALLDEGPRCAPGQKHRPCPVPTAQGRGHGRAGTREELRVSALNAGPTLFPHTQHRAEAQEHSLPPPLPPPALPSAAPRAP